MRNVYDTGDNPSRGREVLQASFELLIRAGYKLHHGLKSTEKDSRKRTYTYLLSYTGRKLYLVATSKWPSFKPKGYIEASSQKFLLIDAAKQGAVLLFSVWPDEDTRPHWRVFNPAECLRTGHENNRNGVIFVNYEWDLGRDLRSLAHLWDTVDRGAGKPEVKLDDYSVSANADPDLIHCTGCPAVFSKSVKTFPRCPICGTEATA